MFLQYESVYFVAVFDNVIVSGHVVADLLTFPLHPTPVDPSYRRGQRSPGNLPVTLPDGALLAAGTTPVKHTHTPTHTNQYYVASLSCKRNIVLTVINLKAYVSCE